MAATARIVAYLDEQNAGQCGPCVNGLGAMSRAWRDLAEGRAGVDVVEWLTRWAAQVTGRGACHHPDGAARLVLSALRTFSADVSAHRLHHRCLNVKATGGVTARTFTQQAGGQR